MRASCLQPFQENPQRQRHDQKPECQMPLIQIHIKIPQSPVFIGCIANKTGIRRKGLKKVSSLYMLISKLEKGSSASENHEAYSQNPSAHFAPKPFGQGIQHHEKAPQ